MKKLAYGVLIGLILAGTFITFGAITSGAPSLAYVYSNSMEPLIKANDAFIVWPTDKWNVGDIIVYRPVVLEAPSITHRMIAIGESGFITKGDNSPYSDQMSGEPAVKLDRIVGKVISINGKPLVFPGLGTIPRNVDKGLGSYTKYLAGLLITLGIMNALWGIWFPPRRRKARHRWRLRDIYRSAGIIALGFVVLSLFFSSRVTQVRYLVSDNPGTDGYFVSLDQPGKVAINVKNNGWLPVWNISSGFEPMTIEEAPNIIWPLSEEKIIISIPPQQKTGWYQGYVQIYNYPILFPRSVLIYLHKINPYLALASIGLALSFWFTLLVQILNRMPGLEEWIPLRAIKDKMTERRLQRSKAKILGRIRGRN